MYVDPSGSTDDTGAGNAVLSNFDHNSVYYQSGIGYFAANPTGSFSFSGFFWSRKVFIKIIN